MMRNLLFILSVFLFAQVFAQEDSVRVFSYEDYIKIVREHHPVVKQANLKINAGNAKLLYAKGAFDPKVYTNINQKYFNENQYYSNINGGVKIPTWFGLEFKGGYEQNDGVYLNNQNTTPNAGLLYAGVSFSVGQGLLIDKRRAELQKARLYQQISETERKLLLNNLLFEAGNAYWDWFESYNELKVYEDAHQLAVKRFEAVKQGAELGSRPFIDTLEAGIQVQNRMLGVQQSKLNFIITSAYLSVYLWAEGIIPLELAEGTIPVLVENINAVSVDTELIIKKDSLIQFHPKINQSRYKLSQLSIDKRWKTEQLKPVLNLKYNPITEAVGDNILGNYTVNNYTWGLEFQFPIFLRKERGNLDLINLKIKDSELQLSNSQVTLQYKLKASINQWRISEEQIKLYSQTVLDYGNLVKGEYRLFNAGESNLFMVNSREVGYIKTELKLIELFAKNRVAELTTKYVLGSLSD